LKRALALLFAAVALGLLSLLLLALVWLAPQKRYPDLTPERSAQCPTSSPWSVEGLCLSDEQVLAATNERSKTQNDFRTSLLQGFAGLFLAVGAVLTLRQLQATREGQITDRYTKAIDQLKNTNTAASVGAVYALERIARDSRRDRKSIAEVLCTFVRTAKRKALDDAEVALLIDDDEPNVRRLDRRAPDVNAAAMVLSEWAKRIGSKLDYRDLHGADLKGWHQHKAELSHSYLFGAELQGADLEGANLKEANLYHANLQGSNLRRAKLQGADLRYAKLDGAAMKGAEADASTQWPDTWSDRAVRLAAGIQDYE
jgi:uncharacterized protein YjbI with pentapeptide repeats